MGNDINSAGRHFFPPSQEQIPMQPSLQIFTRLIKSTISLQLVEII